MPDQPDIRLYEEIQEILDRYEARAVMVFILGEPDAGSQDICIVRPDSEQWVMERYERLSGAWRHLFGQKPYGYIDGVVDGETGRVEKLRAVMRIREGDGEDA